MDLKRYTMKHYSVLKKNEIVSFTGKWMELVTMLSGVSQVQKHKGHMFSLICARQISGIDACTNTSMTMFCVRMYTCTEYVSNSGTVRRLGEERKKQSMKYVTSL
jgi:hypothetical protein